MKWLKKIKIKSISGMLQWEWWLRISNIKPLFHYWKDLSSLLEQRWVIRPSCSDRIVHKSYNLQLKSTGFSKPFWKLFFGLYFYSFFFFLIKYFLAICLQKHLDIEYDFRKRRSVISGADLNFVLWKMNIFSNFCIFFSILNFFSK